MFFTVFENLCKSHGKTTTGVCAEIGVSKSTVAYWRANKSVIPKAEVLAKIADYFKVTTNYLLSSNEEKEDSIKLAIWGGDAKFVDDEMLDDVKDFAKMLMEKKKRKLKTDANTHSENTYKLKIAARNGDTIKEVTITDSDLKKINDLPDLDI